MTARRKGHRLYIKQIKGQWGKNWPQYRGHCSCGLFLWTSGPWESKLKAHNTINYEFRRHKDEEASKGVPMEFIGKVFLTKTTHEYWVASRMGQFPTLPDVVSWSSKGGYSYSTARHVRKQEAGLGWWVLIKKNGSWRLGPQKLGFPTAEEARQSAVKHMKRYERRGRSVQYAVEVEDTKSIQKPMMSFQSYLEDIIRRCNDAETPVQAKKLQKEIDEILALKDAVAQARINMNRRVTNPL